MNVQASAPVDFAALGVAEPADNPGTLPIAARLNREAPTTHQAFQRALAADRDQPCADSVTPRISGAYRQPIGPCATDIPKSDLNQIGTNPYQIGTNP
jgi:hypothetical protein